MPYILMAEELEAPEPFGPIDIEGWLDTMRKYESAGQKAEAGKIGKGIRATLGVGDREAVLLRLKKELKATRLAGEARLKDLKDLEGRFDPLIESIFTILIQRSPDVSDEVKKRIAEKAEPVIAACVSKLDTIFLKRVPTTRIEIDFDKFVEQAAKVKGWVDKALEAGRIVQEDHDAILEIIKGLEGTASKTLGFTHTVITEGKPSVPIEHLEEIARRMLPELKKKAAEVAVEVGTEQVAEAIVKTVQGIIEQQEILLGMLDSAIDEVIKAGEELEDVLDKYDAERSALMDIATGR